MFAVCVTFEIAQGAMDDFLPLMHENAQASLATEEGCLRFDVLTDPDRADEVFLYELYADAAAFQTHLDSGHFRTFDQAVAGMIKAKDVRSFRTVTT